MCPSARPGKLERVPQSENMGAPALSCPACAEALTSAVAWPLTVSACEACGAIWLSNSAAQAALRAHQPNLLRLAVRLADEAHAPSRDAGEARPCAECRVPMQVTPMWNERVTIDVCPAHGTFFDPGELKKVLDHRVPPPVFAHTTDEELARFRRELRSFETNRNGEIDADEAHGFLTWVIGTLIDAWRDRRR